MAEKHPVQPLVWDGPVVRFKQNAIVRFLVDWCAGQNDSAGYPKFSTPNGAAPNLNVLSLMGFSKDDWTQLAQLIGYSVSGAGDLSYFDRRVLAAADREVDKMVRAKKRKKVIQVRCERSRRLDDCSHVYMRSL